eukprot:g32432.t1
MAQQHRELNFDFVPETFVLPQQLRSFKQRYLKTRSEQLWIVKPTASSQGRGIFILRNLVELPMKESVVVSRYVEKPLLIQGLKFDLRIYVMVTSFRPLRAYVYREGLTRFASKAYSTDEEHLADVYRHLTNYSINKGAENFQENQRVQADNYGHKPAISAATKESCLHEQSCFELYGFDILVDEHLKPDPIEVNLSPSMQAESPLDKQIKSSLLSDARPSKRQNSSIAQGSGRKTIKVFTFIDAFNLLGVKRLDAQTLTSARLRARFLYMSKLQSQMPGKRSADKVLPDPLRPEEPRLEKTEEPSVAEGDAEGEPQPLVRKYFSPKKQVSLSTLCEPHLRLLVYALEETQRCCLSAQCSAAKQWKLLTAVLFAQQMPLCDEPELEDKEPPPPEAELISAPEPEPVPKVAQEGNLQMVEEALQTLKVLGTKMSSQLLLMEYIVRLLNTCHQLSDGARRKLENRQQSAIAGVLQIFRQQLALYLRASERGARARGAHRAPAVPAAPAAELATGPSEELPGGSWAPKKDTKTWKEPRPYDWAAGCGAHAARVPFAPRRSWPSGRSWSLQLRGMLCLRRCSLPPCVKEGCRILWLRALLIEIMARSAWKALPVAALLVAMYNFCSWSFVPAPLRKHAPVAAASAASMMLAPAAFADEIGDAAKKLGDASYDFAKEVDWNNGIFLQAPGKFQPLKALKAIDKMIEMGAAADPKLLKAAAEAHHKAIGSISGPNGVTSRADWDAVNAALGRVVASVPKAKVMDVYNSVKDITDPGVPAYMKSLVNGADAEKAYAGFLAFKDVVEKNQVTAVGAPATVPSGDKIGVAAKALSDASYPFLKEVDWLSDVYLKPLPDTTASKVVKAIDKMIVMGSQMDGNLLKAAAQAHHKAIGSIDAKGVTSAADYEAVNAAIGRIVASVPKATVMDVYNAMAAVTDGSVPNNMFSKVNPLDALVHRRPPLEGLVKAGHVRRADSEGDQLDHWLEAAVELCADLQVPLLQPKWSAAALDVMAPLMDATGTLESVALKMKRLGGRVISVGKLDHLDLNFEDLMPREILLVTTELGDLVEASQHGADVLLLFGSRAQQQLRAWTEVEARQQAQRRKTMSVSERVAEDSPRMMAAANNPFLSQRQAARAAPMAPRAAEAAGSPPTAEPLAEPKPVADGEMFEVLERWCKATRVQPPVALACT